MKKNQFYVEKISIASKEQMKLIQYYMRIYSFCPTRSQSYQALISLFLRFLLLNLSVCSIRKYSLYFEMAKLKTKKWKNPCFTKKKVW